MNKSMLSLFFCFILFSLFSQESYFECNEIDIYIPNKTIVLHFDNLSKQDIETKIHAFIKEKNYTFKPFYSNDNRIAFRDFRFICTKEKCTSDVIAKNIFFIDYDSQWIKITLEKEIYSSYFSAKLYINENDDVASENNIPFGIYNFQISEKYAKEFPEAMYIYTKKGKTVIQRPEIKELFLAFYNQYIIDLKNYIEK
ncbi:conserved exported hypothetical protein [Flavobacterium sp. 9AF]|uniref:hypothetical protein n=1 Tax=Flavobacterium sp. 9AF TaxID=2653142 RepID=UPI0012F3420A|nr:hypothetical protein [Flavobacterium sp. 9AF]VXB67184.1 conserved exported hypothetical protein [Flavobacterium sp. 9AF]